MLEAVDKVLSFRAPKRALFRRVGRIYSPSHPDYIAITNAYRESRRACKNRMREDGTTAFGHGRAVALIGLYLLNIRDPAQIQACLLHDVVEDIRGYTHREIRAMFGARVAYLIRWLSKNPRKYYASKAECDRAYRRRFHKAPKKVLAVKLADVLHNLRTLFACSVQKQKRIVAAARRTYLPLAKRHGILAKELEAAIGRVEEGWAKRGRKSAKSS